MITAYPTFHRGVFDALAALERSAWPTAQG
jgi:hypothetical protein